MVTTDASLQRIGLRYINQIEMEGDTPSVEQYLTLVPPLTKSLDQEVRAFYQRYELVQTTPPGLLVHQTGTQQLDNLLPVLILDLDFISEDVSHLDDATLEDWLDAAHTRVYQAFVDSLNPSFYDQLRTGEP
jgi:uncharacterized protein (TIGR04255 family)